MPVRNIYLKIEAIHDYSPVAPDSHGEAGRDCMRNAGHADGTIPLEEVRARWLGALIYREYLDHHWLVPKPDKIVFADVNEPPFLHRVPGAVIYAKPGDRLRIHVKNADVAPHSFHLHGLSHGIDSDGVWPFGTQSRDGRRSDEICPGQTWTYTFDVGNDMLGAWPFHDHYRDFVHSVSRGLFGGVVVLSAEEFDALPSFPLPERLIELLKELEHHRPSASSLAAAAESAGHASALPPALRHQIVLLEEYAHTPQLHLIPKPPLPLHVPIFLHRMSDGENLPSCCFNGRCFTGNTPTILAESGQRIRWCVFNLDFEPCGHCFQPHGQRWRFGNETLFTRSLGPAESFITETHAPPVLLLPPEIEMYQSSERRPSDAQEYRLRGDFPFHSSAAKPLKEGLVGLLRATQTVWLTPEDAARLRAETGLPLDLGDNDCAAIDLDRFASSVDGKWQLFLLQPEITMMHAMLLPNSRRVLFWGYGPRPDQSRIWDQDTGLYSQPAPQPQKVTDDQNIWSCAHAYLNTPEGTILINGGYASEPVATGKPKPPRTHETERRCLFFDPVRLAWSQAPDTQVNRFYATTLTLGDGRLLTLCGQDTLTGDPAASLEVFTPGAGASWGSFRKLPATFDYLYYPWTFLLPNGDLFIAGPQTPARRFDWTPDDIKDDPKKQWSFEFGIPRGENMNGTAVLLPLEPPDYKVRILVAGGSPDGAAESVEMIDLSADNPEWQIVAKMSGARDQLSSVILPDGHIFIAGGRGDGLLDGGPVELFDCESPAGGLQVGPVMKFRRRYHSAAILLSDGSVLMGGDTNGNKDGHRIPHERYLPAYFFQPRPEILDAPASVAYGASFTVETHKPAAIGKVVLMRPGAVTHGFDASQRSVGCEIVKRAGTSLDVKAPPHGNVAPPGHYLLFLVDLDRVPSTAVWIRLENSP